MKSFIFILLAAFSFGFAKGQASNQQPEITVLIDNFYKADSLQEKQLIYDKLQQKFPENKVRDISINYDELKRILAINYLLKSNLNNYQYYIGRIKDKPALAVNLNNISTHWMDTQKGLEPASVLAFTVIKLNEQIINSPARYKPHGYNLDVWRQQLKDERNSYLDNYAYILYKQKKYEQALGYLKPVYMQLNSPNDEVAEHYALVLGATHHSKEAIKVIEAALNTGYRSEIILNELKNDYSAVNGSADGFDKYFADLAEVIRVKRLARYSKAMINERAPEFSLKDIEGKTVSLKDFKGKIVIIDFWATWCMPCKDSFPGMQMAVNKYKDDNNVKFLFIDTWENNKDYTANAQKFIAENKYPFYVLIDEENASGKQSKISTAFKVTGVPTKLVIDKNGNIRFRDIGYAGTANELVEDISTMIDLSANEK